MFANFGIDTVVMIGLAAGIGAYLYRLEKKEKSDPFAALYKQYKTLSSDTLQTLSDDEIVRAVAVNVMAKTDRRHPDVYHLLPLLSHGQAAVYSVWLLCNELKTADLKTMLNSATGRFLSAAADGFALIGAENCAAALAEETPDETVLRDAIAAEKPLSLCAAYIRDNMAEFTA